MISERATIAPELDLHHLSLGKARRIDERDHLERLTHRAASRGVEAVAHLYERLDVPRVPFATWTLRLVSTRAFAHHPGEPFVLEVVLEAVRWQLDAHSRPVEDEGVPPRMIERDGSEGGICINPPRK